MLDLLEKPDWLEAVLAGRGTKLTPEDALALSVEIAVANVRNGGGPFAAVMIDPDGNLFEVGWNHVVASADSTAHAEVHCLRRAQRRLGSHDLSTSAAYTLCSSCAPCIQCFGALYWSGISRVVAAASKEEAEKLGFLEGPVSPALWDDAKAVKGIEFRLQLLDEEERNLPFREYQRIGGDIY